MTPVIVNTLDCRVVYEVFKIVTSHRIATGADPLFSAGGVG
jgi:hypothetical protein